MEVLDQSEFNHNGKPLEQVLSEGYNFNLGDYIGKGFRLFGNDGGSYIGFALVSFVISFAVGVIPILGTIAGLIISPALQGGWYIYGYKHSTGQPKSFSNFFDGFKSPAMMQLVLGNLIVSIFTGLVVAVVLVPCLLFLGLDLFSSLSSFDDVSDPTAMRDLMLTFFTGKLLLVILLSGLAGITVYVLYCLTPMFIIQRGMGFWDAMEASRKVVSKNYFQFFIFLFVLVILIVVGAFMCGLGLLVAIPVFYLSLYSAFEDIMGVGANNDETPAITI